MKRPIKLYCRCFGCDGTRVLKTAVHVDVTRTQSANLKPGTPCPLCEDGYCEVGLTQEQVERLTKDRNALREAAEFTLRTLDMHRDPKANVLAKMADREIAEAKLRDAVAASHGKKAAPQ